MLPDSCGHCGESIYPNDEKVSIGLDIYHFECAESLDLEEDESLKVLARDLDKSVEDRLAAQVAGVVDDGKDPAKWCQEMMTNQSIPQAAAARFLKENHGISVTLLPEPKPRIVFDEAHAVTSTQGLGNHIRSIQDSHKA